MKNHTQRSNHKEKWIQAFCLALSMLTVALARDDSPVGRSIAFDRNGDEFNLRWVGITNAVYEPQIRTNLVQGSWNFLDTVVGTGGQIVYPVSSSNLPSAFYRVLFPQPVVTAGEPARYAYGAGGSYLYITGQYFYEGDQVRVGGILANNAVLLSHSLLRVELPPGLPPGRHDVEILSNTIGAVLGSLHEAVTVVDPATSPTTLLAGPPEMPAAIPMGLWASKRGYDYYKAKSDMSSANAQNNPYFTENPLSGSMPLIAAWLSKKGYDYYQSLSAMAYEIQEGKKGINAVNVKEARTTGSVAGISAGVIAAIVIAARTSGANDPTVTPFSGEVQQQVIDLAVEGRGLDFVWARTYHSRLGRTGSATNGWTFSYDLHLQPLGGDMLIHNGMGRSDRYVLQTNGVYTCPEFFCEGTLSANVFRLTFPDTGYWEFRSLTATTAPGKLDRIVDRNGNTVSMTYDTAGRLSGVVDALGRAYTVGYDTAGRLVSVTDFSARTVRYEYDGHGDLVACVSPAVVNTPNGNDFPNGKTNLYTYTSGSLVEAENHLLTSCVDGLGQTTINFVYDLDPVSAAYLRCTSFQRGAYVPTMITYQPQTPNTDNQFATMRCIVNDPLGNVSELLLDARGRGIDKKDIKRRAEPGVAVTDTSSLPFDKLRPEDPEFTVTRWTWNNDSLCTVETAPGGQELRYTYQGDLEPATPARKRADCRVVRERAPSAADLDGDGTPDTSERVWYYTYDPRFGTIEPSKQWCFAIMATDSAIGGRKGWDGTIKGNYSARDRYKGWDGTIKGHYYSARDRYKGWDGTIKGLYSARGGRKGWDGTIKGKAARSPIKEDCDDGNPSPGDGFVTSVTDPRGNVTTGEFDETGNCRALIVPVTRSSSGVVTFSHNAYGQPTAITNAPDASGFSRVDTFTYHGTGPQTGYLESIAIDEPGVHLTTAFEYDTRGNVTRVVDPRGNDLLVTYNALNQPITVPKQTQGATFGERVKTTLFYDANDNLVRIDRDNRGPDGAFDPLNPQWTTRFNYDSLQRLTQVAQEVAKTAVGGSVMTNQFVYDANDQLTLHRLPEAVSGSEPNNVVAYAYDDVGLLFSAARAPGSGLSTTTTFDYDVNGNLVRVNKSDSVTLTQTLFAYDGFDRCVTTLDPMGNMASRAFDANDNLIYERTDGETDDRPGNKGNRKLAETRYTYDTLDRCVACIDSFFDIFTEAAIGDGEATTAWTYAPNGQLMSVTDDNGATSTYTYDRAGRLASVTDPRGNVSSYAYDPCGNVLVATQSDLSDVSAGQHVFTKTYTYDALGRWITATDNVGNSVSNAYDACNNLVSSTDPKGNETAYVYDGLGRVTGTANYSGSKERGITINTSHVEYRNNRLVSTTDANTNMTAYAYDACDRLTQVTHPDTTVESLIWSPRSNLERCTDGNGTIITNQYDLCDRLIHRDVAVGAGVLDTTTFEIFSYDGLGRLVTAQNNASTLLYSYDSLGNRVTSSQNDFLASATFDGLGNRRTCTCPSGYFIQSTYDALNRPVSITVHPDHNTPSDLLLMTFAYDGPDRLAKITRGNGINTRVFWDGVQGTPNAAGDYGWRQVSRVNHAQAGGGLIVDQRVSLYDRNQNKVTRAMTAPWSSGGTLVTNSYTYDAVNRLTQSHKNGSIIPTDMQYVYDANGNRLQVTNNGVAEVYTMDPTMPDPADFQMNQYTDTPFGSEYHDAQGNRVGRTSTARSLSYKYDYADRLVQVDELDPIGSYVTLVTYSYDPLGRRIGKTLFDGGGLPLATSTFVYDDGKDDDCDGTPDDDVMEVYKGAAVSSVSVLAGGAGGGAAAASYAATGRMLSPPVGFLNAAGEAFYTHCDERGNMLALTDAAGNVVEHYDYADFGAPSFFDASGTLLPRSSVTNDVLFSGMRWDEETELYHREGTNPLFQGNSNAGNNPLSEPSSCSGGGGTHFDPLTGRPLSRARGNWDAITKSGIFINTKTTALQRNIRKTFFETGDIPTQDEFGSPIDSFVSGGGGTRAQDHNSSRSHGCGGSTRAQDHNSSRSNKTASFAAPDGGSGGGLGYTPVNLINPIAMDKGLRF